MRIVLQRVKRASVSIDGRVVGAIDRGVMILLGIHTHDSVREADFLAAKCAELRIFTDPEGKMNLSLIDVAGAALVVSQFTLYGNCRKGRRPSFVDAAPPDKGRLLYEYFIAALREKVPNVKTGLFGAMMDVELVNDGPVTIILDKDPEQIGAPEAA
jgi:D-tyrosyl-tRNA(Tyr) deacylase